MKRLIWLALSCTLACAKKSEAPKAVEKVPETFLCVRHGERHALNEVAYGWPDAVFALALPAAEKERLTALRNQDLMVVGEGHFVRGWAPLPVKQRQGEWGIGFWVRVSAESYAAIERAGDVKSKFEGTVANQGLYGAPTLGLAALLEPRGEGWRPAIRFTDASHPLAVMQKDGVSETVWRQWLSDTFHQGEPEPLGAPFEGALERHGWSILEPAAAGKTAVEFKAPPAKGDTVKVLMAVRTSDVNGDPSTINAGWWVRVDDTSRADLWSGTLASETRVEATIRLGSRIWFKPGQVVQHALAEADSAAK